MPIPDERQISKIAHDLWVQEGQPAGRERDLWDAAKEIWAYRTARHEALAPRPAAEDTRPAPRSDVEAADPKLSAAGRSQPADRRH